MADLTEHILESGKLKGEPILRIIDVAEARTLPGLFKLRAELTPAALAYIHWSERADAWQEITWRDAYDATLPWRAALAGEGLEPGDRIAILLPNRPEWIFMEQAALALGLVAVPLYNWDSGGNIAHILGDSGARLLLLESVERARELKPQLSDAPNLRRIIAVSGEPEDEEKVVLLADWLFAPRETGRPPEIPDDPDALATLIYTSGTTSRPKGVMLSHRNILSNAAAILERVPPRADDVFLSVLPLAHAYERTVGYYVPMMAGLPTAYARTPSTIAEDIATHRPTVMLVVPRLLERIHVRIQKDLARRSALARRLFALTLAAGWRCSVTEPGRGGALWARIAWPLLRRLVAKKLIDRLGGRLRVLVSGGAQLSPEVSRLFHSLGIPVIQGYGMTETSPVVATTLVGEDALDSVGLPLKGCEIDIGEEQELLVRSPGVMLGYWNQPDKTRAVIGANGWLHTGDRGEIREGRVYVTGRLGEVVKLSTGHKVSLGAVESAILQDPLFDQVIALAQDRADVVAIAVLNPGEWRSLAASLGVDADDPASLTNERVMEDAMRRMTAQLGDLPPYCRPKGVVLDTEPWSVEAGLLTPTLKVKRKVVAAHYRPRLIEIRGP